MHRLPQQRISRATKPIPRLLALQPVPVTNSLGARIAEATEALPVADIGETAWVPVEVAAVAGSKVDIGDPAAAARELLQASLMNLVQDARLLERAQ